LNWALQEDFKKRLVMNASVWVVGVASLISFGVLVGFLAGAAAFLCLFGGGYRGRRPLRRSRDEESWESFRGSEMVISNRTSKD